MKFYAVRCAVRCAVHCAVVFLTLIGRAAWAKPPPVPDPSATILSVATQLKAANSAQAAALLAVRLAAWGYKPGGENGTFLQRVPVEAYRLLPDATIETPHGTLRADHDFVLLPPFLPLRQEVTGQAVLVGCGIQSAALKRDDLKGMELNGKIAVVVGAGAPPANVARAIWDEATRPNVVMGNLLRAHASAVVFVDPVIDGLAYSQIADRLRQPILVPAQAFAPLSQLGPNYPPLVLVGPSAGATLLGRTPAEYAALVAEARTGRPVTAGVPPATLTVRVRVALENTAGINVIGILPGTDTGRAKEAVLLSASYNTGEGTLRAGTLLATAQIVAQSPRRPGRSVVVLASFGGETGAIGAAYWVAHPTWATDKILADLHPTTHAAPAGVGSMSGVASTNLVAYGQIFLGENNLFAPHLGARYAVTTVAGTLEARSPSRGERAVFARLGLSGLTLGTASTAPVSVATLAQIATTLGNATLLLAGGGSVAAQTPPPLP